MSPQTSRTALAALLALTTLLAGPAAAAAPSPAPRPATSAELRERVAQQERALAGDVATQAELAVRASAALEAHQAAQRAADAAQRQAEQHAQALAAATARAEEARERLSGYVGSLYRTGMGSTSVAMYTSLLDAGTPQQLFSGLSMATRVGGNHNDAVTVLARAQAEQTQAAAQAQLSATAAEAATVEAARTRAEADRVVAEQSRRVAQARAALAATTQVLVETKAREDRFARAVALARQRSAAPLAAIEGALAPRPVAGCTGGTTAGYPNGQIPTSVLCPLWGTSGQLLRADAAAAFNEMSKAFGTEFGEPLCVTDSYRSLPEQIAVAAAKPHLAAVPGTSNHGWGVAVDLCGGVQSFGTAQHLWMVANSMAYGWFHPARAQQDGSKPEAWHWEYAG